MNESKKKIKATKNKIITENEYRKKKKFSMGIEK